MVNTSATELPAVVNEISTETVSQNKSEDPIERPGTTDSVQPITLVTSLQADNRGEVVQIKHAEQQRLDVAIQNYKSTLTSVQCLKTESLAKHGVTRFNDKVLKCNNCFKHTTGKAALALLNQEIGRRWKTASPPKTADPGAAEVSTDNAQQEMEISPRRVHP